MIIRKHKTVQINKLSEDQLKIFIERYHLYIGFRSGIQAKLYDSMLNLLHELNKLIHNYTRQKNYFIILDYKIAIYKLFMENKFPIEIVEEILNKTDIKAAGPFSYVRLTGSYLLREETINKLNKYPAFKLNSYTNTITHMTGVYYDIVKQSGFSIYSKNSLGYKLHNISKHANKNMNKLYQKYALRYKYKCKPNLPILSW